MKILPDLPRFVIEPAGVTVLFVVGLLPPLLGGGLDEVRNALPALVGVVFASLRLAAPLQAVFRAVNKLRASFPISTMRLHCFVWTEHAWRILRCFR